MTATYVTTAGALLVGQLRVGVVEVLEAAGVDGLRVHATPPPSVVPPAAVVGQPSVEYASAGGCTALYRFPIHLLNIYPAGGEVAAASLLDDLLVQVGEALRGVKAPPPARAYVLERADFQPVSMSGQQWPAYTFTLAIYA